MQGELVEGLTVLDFAGRCAGCFGGQEVPRGSLRGSLCASGVQESMLEVQGEIGGP